jgi:hypothetical protein
LPTRVAESGIIESYLPRRGAPNVGTNSSPVRAGIKLHRLFRCGAALRHCYNPGRREDVLERGVLWALRATGLVLFGVHLLRDLREAKERKRELEAAERRSQARSERIDRAKATVADAARTATSSAAKVAGRAKAKVAGAFKRTRFWERENRPE